ncbi:pre-rRNA processing [Elasticomyces elasticus]|nr:pre-rRNA processing [Elasticomyces elasticus]
MMHTEGSFPRLVELIQARRDDDLGLHRLLIELLYEMSRIQPLTWEDLASTHSNDASLNHVKLVLNEQYMCLAHAPPPPSASEDPNARPRLTNRILKLLSSHGSDYRTFGENLILLLNRESGLSPQLLILKLLYLLFTTPSTYEYFYTNDLHVLVDVIIRNLLDLDPGSDEDDGPEDGGGGVKASEGGGGQRALSHTYLRVLCPLLRNTQLAREGNHYKKEEVRKVLHLLVNRSSMHLAPVDETVMRLVARCKAIDWIRKPEDDADDRPNPVAEAGTRADGDAAKRPLGMNMREAAGSSLSIMDVAARVEKERPELPAPRRRRKRTGLGAAEGADGHHDNAQARRGSELTVPSVGVRPRTPVTDTGQPRRHADERGRSPFADVDED